MNVKILGNLDNIYLNRIIKKTQNLIKIPKNLNIYFLENINLCYNIKLPRNIQEKFKLACAHNISFSLKFKKRKVIVIYLDKKLLENSSNLIGLLLHEIEHIIQMDKGIYTKIYQSYNKVYNKNINLFKNLKYDKQGLKKLFNDISLIALLTLKDIYTNNELINKKLTNYLISYYKTEFNRKVCPKPIFYKNLKISAEKDLSAVKSVFDFELSLLSVILPLYKTKKAKNLINFIEKCYEINIKDISEKCRELINLYFNEFNEKDFNEKFFNSVFMKVYNLLK